ncbi:MAG: ankyrin repeat domain-containing protein [Candidatus Dependentiae bacterium]
MNYVSILATIFYLLASHTIHGLSHYQKSLKANLDQIEKEHSVKKAIHLILNLPVTAGLDLLYSLLLSSKVYTITEREAILDGYLKSPSRAISQTDEEHIAPKNLISKEDLDNLYFIKEKFLNALKIVHEGPRVSYLVAGPNAQLCNKKSTLLMKAVNENRYSLIKKLLSLGVFVNATDTQGLTALFFAPNIKIAQLLLDHNANINHTDNTGSSILFYEEDPVLIKFFINKGASITHENNEGYTALAHHATQNNIRAIQALLDNGANINQFNDDELTVLDLIEDDLKVTAQTKKFLINKGAKTSQEIKYLLHMKKGL